MKRSALLRELLKKQDGLPDYLFAERLGLSRSYWSHVKAGTRRLTDQMVRRVRILFPDLEDLCISALLEETSDAA